MVDEVHELVELRRDDNLRATVALMSELGGVGGQGVVLASSSGCEALGVNTVVVLQGLYYA